MKIRHLIRLKPGKRQAERKETVFLGPGKTDLIVKMILEGKWQKAGLTLNRCPPPRCHVGGVGGEEGL